MFERNNYLAVGVFILVGAVALAAVGFWVSGAGKTVPTTQYTIIFERDVNGLSEGSPVRYMGVDVGEVTSIALFRAAETAIEVRIEVDSTTPIDAGTYASLGYQGITGVAFINLAADAGMQGSLVEMAGSDYPVIRTRDVGFAALMNSGPEVVTQITNVLGSIDALFSAQNLDSARHTLANLEQLTSALAENRQAMADLPGRMNESLDKLQDTLDAVADFTDEAKPELLLAAQDLHQSAATLVNVTGKVEQWLVENDAAVEDFLANGIGETAALMADTRETMRELEKLGAELRSDPSRFIYKPKHDPVVVAQ